jgi:hypothetical protein
MRTTLDKILVLFAFCLASFGASSHPGRTDSNGGHNDRKHGGYHYHGGPYLTATPKAVTPKAITTTKSIAKSLPKPKPISPEIVPQSQPAPAQVPPSGKMETGYLINGKTYVPLRFVAENLGAQVTWDGPNKIAYISTPGSPEPILVKVQKR